MNEAPPPAEAATEVGQEEPNFYSAQYMLEELGIFVVGIAAVIAFVAGVAFLIGRFL
jgi:hypothetical protein